MQSAAESYVLAHSFLDSGADNDQSSCLSGPVLFLCGIFLGWPHR